MLCLLVLALILRTSILFAFYLVPFFFLFLALAFPFLSLFLFILCYSLFLSRQYLHASTHLCFYCSASKDYANLQSKFVRQENREKHFSSHINIFCPCYIHITSLKEVSRYFKVPSIPVHLQLVVVSQSNLTERLRLSNFLN